jgi:hypothetical protein
MKGDKEKEGIFFSFQNTDILPIQPPLITSLILFTWPYLAAREAGKQIPFWVHYTKH